MRVHHFLSHLSLLQMVMPKEKLPMPVAESRGARAKETKPINGLFLFVVNSGKPFQGWLGNLYVHEVKEFGF